MDNKLSSLKEGLREQTIVIEDCTAELKLLLNNAVFKGLPFNTYYAQAIELIDKQTEEIQDKSLQQNARLTLSLYAKQEYGKLRSVLMMRPGFSFTALALVLQIWNSETVSAKERAYKRLQIIEPQLQGNNLMFASGQGKSWRWGVPLDSYMKSYMKRVDETSNMLANDSVMGIDGLPLRLKSELYIRQQFHINEMDELRKNGTEYVWISSHENCSPRCQPNQGKLYNMNGKTGVLDGIPFRPIESATDIYQVTKNGKAYKNGTLSGFGCRHYTIVYVKNGLQPPKLSDERVEKAWEIEKEQRRLERDVFHLREKYYAFKGNNNIKAKKYYSLALEKKKDYIAFCRENEVAWYPSRIRVNP